MKKAAWIVLLGLGLSPLATAQNIVGTWRTIDDKTGYALAHIKIEQLEDQSYIGTIVEQFPFPGQPMIMTCQKCPAPYTDKAIKGLQIIQALKEDPRQPENYQFGKILDPLSGKIYRLKAKVTPDGKRLRLRGYIGSAIVGRNQTWLRKE